MSPPTEGSTAMADRDAVLSLELPAPLAIPPAPRARGTTRLSLTSRAPELLLVHAARDAWRVGVLLIADVAALLLLWLAVQGLVWGPSIPTRIGQFIGAIIVALAILGCYGSSDQRRGSGAIVQAAGLGTLVALWATIWSGPVTASLILLPALWAAAAIALLLERRLLDRLVRVFRPGGSQVLRAAVVAVTEDAVRLIDHPAFGESSWCHLVAFFDPRRYPTHQVTRLARLIRDHRIDTMILAGRLSGNVFAAALDVAAASGCQVFSLPRISPTSSFLPKVLWRNGCPVVELTRPGLMGTKLLMKRAIDLLIAGTALVLLAPLFAVIALAIKLTARGPVFFRQTRIGQGGRTFTILKFRSMVPDAELHRAELMHQSLYDDGLLFKVVDDPRVTPLGRLLRRTSLDELPQLWNVLRGDMSLVGPRPPLPSEVELYKGHHYARFDVKPGITGPWQVSGRNGVRDFEKVIRLEMAYIRRWSIWLDLELLCRTVPVVLSRRNAH